MNISEYCVRAVLKNIGNEQRVAQKKPMINNVKKNENNNHKSQKEEMIKLDQKVFSEK